MCILTIAIVNMFFTLEEFNDWASYGFIIGTIFTLSLNVDGCVVWRRYEKSKQLRVTRLPVTDNSATLRML